MHRPSIVKVLVSGLSALLLVTRSLGLGLVPVEFILLLQLLEFLKVLRAIVIANKLTVTGNGLAFGKNDLKDGLAHDSHSMASILKKS